MTRRYRLLFELFKTEQEAKEFCDNENEKHIRKKYQAKYYFWTDGIKQTYIAWYYNK